MNNRGRVYQTRIAAAAVCALAIVLACSVDNRELVAGISSSASGGRGGSGGTSTHEGGLDAATAGASDGGMTGSAGERDGPDAAAKPAVCSRPQLPPNCVQSLLQNATFDSDTKGWTQDPGSTMNWTNHDAAESSKSGSLSVLNSAKADSGAGLVVAGAVQCIPITAGESYAISADVFISSDQGSAGAGGIYVALFASTDCTESTLPYFGQSTLPSATDIWSSAHMTVDTSAPNLSTAHSMSVRVVAQKAFSADPLLVLFDNVLMQQSVTQVTSM